MTGKVIRKTTQGFGYILEETSARGSFGEWEAIWAESALRKLHKPSKYSFDELLSEIKSCNMNTIKA
jgi:hypothetical protein